MVVTFVFKNTPTYSPPPTQKNSCFIDVSQVATSAARSMVRTRSSTNRRRRRDKRNKKAPAPPKKKHSPDAPRAAAFIATKEFPTELLEKRSSTYLLSRHRQDTILIPEVSAVLSVIRDKQPTPPSSPAPPSYSGLFQSCSDSDDPSKPAPPHGKKDFWSLDKIEHATTQIHELYKFVTFLIRKEGTPIAASSSRLPYAASAAQVRRQHVTVKAKRALTELQLD